MRSAGFPSRDSPSRADAVILFLVALAVSLYGIGRKSIGLDESTSVYLAEQGTRWLLSSISWLDPNARLHYLFLSLWIRVFGDSELALRGLSALFAALAVVALYFLGTRLFGRAAGIVAGLLLAANAFLLQYAHNARTYTLLVFLVIGCTWFFVAELEQPSSRNRIGYILTSVAAIYAHFFAALVLAAHAVVLLLVRRRGAFTGQWMRVALGIALLSAPAILLALDAGLVGISWIKKPPPEKVWLAVLDFAGKSPWVLIGLVGAGVVATVRAAGTSQSWKYLLLWTWLVLPTLLSLAVSLRVPVFLSKYLIICVPALLLLGVSGLAQIRSRPWFVGAAALLILAAAAELPREYRAPAPEDWREAAQFLLEGSSPGDAVIFLPEFAEKPFGYYVRRSGRPGPEDMTRSPSWMRDRIWLVTRESDSTNRPIEFRQLRDSLAAGHRIAQRKVFPWISLTLYAR